MSEDPSDGAALFRREGDRFVPSALTQGPWDPDALHGGAVAALAAHGIESLPAPAPMRLCRLSVDLLRAVPMAPLEVETEVLRTGKRLQLSELRIAHQGKPVVRAAGLSIRTERVPGLAEHEVDGPPARTTPDALSPLALDGDLDRKLPGYLRALDFRSEGLRMRGAWSAAIWCRLRVPVVDGAPLTPMVRLAATADFASGLGNPIDLEHYVAINPDLTIQIERPPTSDWIGVEAETHVRADGMGNSQGSVFDLAGRVARVEASLFIDRRP